MCFKSIIMLRGGPRLIFKVLRGGAFNSQSPGGGATLNFSCRFGKIPGPPSPGRKFWTLPNPLEWNDEVHGIGRAPIPYIMPNNPSFEKVKNCPPPLARFPLVSGPQIYVPLKIPASWGMYLFRARQWKMFLSLFRVCNFYPFRGENNFFRITKEKSFPRMFYWDIFCFSRVNMFFLPLLRGIIFNPSEGANNCWLFLITKDKIKTFPKNALWG